MRPFDSDMSVLRQIFVRKEYDLSRLRQFARINSRYNEIVKAGDVPVIVDAGANIGASSIWFSRLFPRAKILALEPDHENAELCRRNCANYINVIVVEAAIGSTPGKVQLVRPDSMSWSIQTRRCDAEGSIKMVTVEQLMSQLESSAKLFVAKIDIEGFEKDLFSSSTDWLSEVAVVAIELHDWLLPYSSIPFQKAIANYEAEVIISGENLIFVK
jgi:FkbM family methyltransferase